MLLEFENGTEVQHNLCASMIEFVIDKLMPRLKDKLYITIEFEQGLYENYFINGDCVVDGEDFRPRDFIIRLDANISNVEMLTTVAHEMVHVKQMARDELRQYSRIKGHRFNGLFISDETEYWDRPWEIEAHGREQGLLRQWIEHNKVLDIA
mgnify:CR=1 FL=1